SQMRDADRLAFLELFEEMTAPGKKSSPEVKTVTDDLHSIQNTYREEVSRIFSQFATRGAQGGREKWDSYVAFLRRSFAREKILTEYESGVTEEVETGMRGAGNPNEISGAGFEQKSVALTFDDGPHPRHTEEVAALLRKYGIRAAFFEVGQNLGTVSSADKSLQMLPAAGISKRLVEAGHVVANHTYSHRVLAKLNAEDRTREIENTSLLLEKAIGAKPALFRPPYGARNREILDQVSGEGMKNIMWTIDSEDWADPIPESIAMRVMHELNKQQKGIILFHDIHKQSVLALPLVLNELKQQNYNFLAWDGKGFGASTPPEGAERSEPAPAPVQTVAGERVNPYRKSWAVIIGINEYEHWPKLRYPVNDANAIEQTLISKFGFQKENIRKLVNGDATRARIMQVLGDELTDPSKVSKDDRVFFFFAGHGATRSLADNRQIGFIIPVDADSANYYSTAISMNALRDASDVIPAKHIYFVMDSCYSGLALTRGGGTFSRDRSYLDEVTRRMARQILTAGGAEQQVADDGPNGHSVFTWALLQGLEGKADLDGNGVITASELGSYVSPVVASFSKQTPTMGNLIGSEGGEFIFELQPEALTPMTQQFEGKALALNHQLAGLEREIAVKQAELLKLQQSVKTETARIAERPAPVEARAAAPQPTKARAYDLDRLGRQAYREKKYDEAAKDFEQAVALKPGDPILLNNLGFLYYEMGRYA
ncbi:MAG TPA: polysaccharide deacetylase family protein, partial [Bryobacteraceae bacterium]|nr:polysaccharide deacetylase family protein [Bryobacteraceae bacterium]